jgi:ABC-type antimicrobial peptide transport system permease subunit
MASETSSFSAARYVAHSSLHYWRTHAAVVLGVLVGTAVLTGALLVGDSVRNSLKLLTLERLGRIDCLLLADHFFEASMLPALAGGDTALAGDSTAVAGGDTATAGDTRSDTGFRRVQGLPGLAEAAGVILLPQVTVENPASGDRRAQRARQVTVLGCEPAFWDFGRPEQRPQKQPAGRQIILNRPLADELQARVGDKLVIRLAKEERIAGDSTMSHKADRLQAIAELEVVEIIAAEGLGRFSLQANQAVPRTAFVPLETIQQSLDLSGKFNAILLAGEPHPAARRYAGEFARRFNTLPLEGDHSAPVETLDLLRQRLKPSLADAGLRLKHVQSQYQPLGEDAPRIAFDYWNLTSDAMLFSPQREERLKTALAGLPAETAFTYLANSITRVAPTEEANDDGASAVDIPYSTISAVETSGPLSPLRSADGGGGIALADDEIALNEWAAKDLGARVGDTIRIRYFAPETTHGDPEERSADFRLKAVVPLVEPAEPFRRKNPAKYVERPAPANDPDLTPEVPGITDQDSIDSWDPPFPFDYGRIRKPKDDDYWNHHRTTPKAFISLQAGQRLWNSRFGRTSSFRIAREADAPNAASSNAADEAMLRSRLEKTIAEHPEDFGFTILPVKQQGLLAARGTTPFQFLFLGFSLFLIAASLMLVSLLFRLNLEQRARELGLLTAVGFAPRRLLRLFLTEGLVVSTVGAILGTLFGIGYAALMLAGLRTWWLDAVVTPFIHLYAHPFSLALGLLLGLATGLATIYLSLRGIRHLAPRNLLGGNLQEAPGGGIAASRPWETRARKSLWGVAGALAAAATRLQGEAQAGAFFGSGVAVLAALLWQVRSWLHATGQQRSRPSQGFGVLGFVTRNLARNPGRSALTLGLTATACFLIVAISAFRLSPTERGTGGFDLIAQTDQPLFDDLTSAALRKELLGPRAETLADATLGMARLRDGDDASCRNLYQVQQPRLIGLPDSLGDALATPARPGFQFAGSVAASAEEKANPWKLLRAAPTDTGAIPVILDKNTAMYSLHLYGGPGQEFELDYGADGKLRFRVVGLLANSILQGSLLLSETQLVKHFPDVSGYRMLLVDVPEAKVRQAAELLEERYGDQGLEATDTRQLLAELLAVQNTYLSTFQSLGGLGLLLGTLGLVAVQLRSVLERRAELALMQATGFARQRIARIVLLEHLLLLLGGLGIGLLAAVLTVLPQAWTTEVQPPWRILALILGTIFLVGIGTGRWILGSVVQRPLIPALRGD